MTEPARLLHFRIVVTDPQTGTSATYDLRSPRKEAAEIEARHAFTGLLGGPGLEAIRDRLVVETTSLTY